MRILTNYLVFIWLFSLPAQAAPEYYVWVDENGVTNFAERNPTGYEAEHITAKHTFGQRIVPRAETRTEAPAPDADLPPTSPETVDPDALIEEDVAAKAAEIAQIKRQNCEIGKDNLAQLKAFARIRVTDEKGENRILTDEEKDSRAEQARQTIRENCTSG